MFCTVSVTRGSRSRLLGHARPSAEFSTGWPSCTSTHTGAACTVPSLRSVETTQKFLPCSSCSAFPSTVALILSTLSRELPKCSQSRYDDRGPDCVTTLWQGSPPVAQLRLRPVEEC